MEIRIRELQLEYFGEAVGQHGNAEIIAEDGCHPVEKDGIGSAFPIEQGPEGAGDDGYDSYQQGDKVVVCGITGAVGEGGHRFGEVKDVGAYPGDQVMKGRDVEIIGFVDAGQYTIRVEKYIEQEPGDEKAE